MAKRTFKTDLSQSGIKQLIKELKDYRDNILPTKLRMISEKLAEQGVDIAQVEIKKLKAVFTGELMDSMTTKMGVQTKTKSVFYVVADSEHAVFVEFGTGQKGLQSPYEHEFPVGTKWEYNTGETIFEFKPGQYGWFYERDGVWYFTQGMPSRPFMYNTYNKLCKQVRKTVKEVFSS